LYELYFNRAPGTYNLQEMARMFLPSSEFRILDVDPLTEGTKPLPEKMIRIPDDITDKNEAKSYLFQQLSALTGQSPDWGILTGVRPVKLAGDMLAAAGSLEAVKERLQNEYYVSEAKANLIISTLQTQKIAMPETGPSLVGLYIGIPFCPTRCLYCSFPSYSIQGAAVGAYIEALKKEIRFTGEKMREKGWRPESVYIGGGTPTSLTSEELSDLMDVIRSSFDLKDCKEYTVEAGRPDTITEEKLIAIRRSGADRISINPQSMNPETLKRIGRAHTPEQVIGAFRLARAVDFSVINADVIAGLLDETQEEFSDSLNELLEQGPENITVHTLSVKRGSQLAEIDDKYSYRTGTQVGSMVADAYQCLISKGYRPYYLYRQKQTTGNHENIGYAKPGAESLYNMRIMEENQTVIALGAGGGSKVYKQKDKRLERVFNVSNYQIYIDRINEMLLRKEAGIFDDREETTCQI
jgi:oxygen-independent coproporphyrinogen-3 oxidase